MNKTRSKVMTIANRLVKQGLIRSIATVKAWIIVKANALRTKVKARPTVRTRVGEACLDKSYGHFR